MTLGAPRRVHIAPQGFEDERIYLPAINNDADSVILLVHPEQSTTGEECKERVIAELEDEDIAVELIDCDLFKLEDALETISEIIYKFQEDYVLVNISTGSKITAVAGMLACMVASAVPYYVRPEDYGSETISKGVKEEFKLPAYPIELVDEETVSILSFISDFESENDVYPALKDLNEYVSESEHSVLEGKNRQNTRKIYDLVNREILEPLEERDLIKIQKVGNQKRVSLTNDGQDTLEFMGYVSQ